MRIIGGTYRSRILSGFDGQEVRPTADRTREALFNILSMQVRGARVLDLFAGSGAVGIEAISRGAKEVVFNDCAKDSLTLLKRNLTSLKLLDSESVKISGSDYLVCLRQQREPFDIIFIDPPYGKEFGIPALEEIAKSGLLRKNGIAVYERDRLFEGEVSGLERFDERKYGKAYLTFFRKGE